jgi:ribosomal protein L37AE/L43A
MTHLLLTTITADERCQPRVRLEPSLVDEYAQAMTEGAAFPPLTVYQDGATHWLADGFHRYHAARQAGIDTIDCTIHSGTLRDAILHAVGANDTHGMRRTNLDKRRAVETLLNDPEWMQWSDREIGRRCAVSHEHVRQLRRSLSTVDSERTYTDRYGNITTMNTANIGHTVDVMLAPHKDLFACEECGELFSVDVWHCEHCDHHWPDGVDDCKNCHHARYPDEENLAFEVVDPSEVFASGMVSRTVAYHPPSVLPEDKTTRAADGIVQTYGRREAVRIARAILRQCEENHAE